MKPDSGGTSIRDLIRNMSWLGAANLAVKPIWFLFVTALCMRVLGVQGYGVFSAAIALTMMATSLTDLGIARYTSREIARDPSSASLLVTVLLPTRLVALLLSAVISIGVATLLGYGRDGMAAVAFASAYAVALQVTQYCRAVFEGFERLGTEAVTLLIEKVLVVGIGSAALFATREAHWTLAGMAAGMTLATIGNVAWIGRRMAPIRPALFEWSFLRRALRTMIPIGLGGMFISVYYRVDLVMVESMLGESPAGQYGVAYRILEALNMITAVVVLAALFPRLSRLVHGGQEREFSRTLRHGQLGLLGISLAAAGSITALAPLIIRLLANDAGFEPAVGALRILVWAFPLLCANSLLYSALLAMEDERFTAWMVGGAVLLNVALNFWMIPVYGIAGAAMATIAPEIVILAIYSRRYGLLKRQVFS